MTATVILLLAGIIVAICHQHPISLEMEERNEDNQYHVRFGWCVMVLIIIQYFMGASLTLFSSRIGRIVRMIHGINGYVCVTLGCKI